MPDSLLIVRHGNGRVGIDLAAVREVVRMLLPDPLPSAPLGVCGVVNLRNEVMPVIDLQARLPAGALAPGVDHHLVVTEIAGVLLAVAVSHVVEIEAIPPGCWQSAEATLPAGVPLLGVARLRDGLVPVLDPAALMKPGEIMELREALERLAQKASPAPESGGEDAPKNRGKSSGRTRGGAR